MLTISDFTAEWKRLHHPSMNVDSDVAFFYEIYCRLRRLIEQDATEFDEQQLLSLLLYTENTIAIGLDGVYEYRYRSVGDVVSRWCDSQGISANVASQADKLVSEAVADAPSVTLRRWMTECVLSGDFTRLSDMLTYFPSEDRVMWRVFPDLRFRGMLFRRLTGNRDEARQMMLSDLAFNWHDKRGFSLAATIAKQFRLQTSFAEEEEKAQLKAAAETLEAVRSERLDTYTVVEIKDGQTLTLRHRDGREFRDVIFPDTIPDNAQGRHLAAMLVTYNDKTYINGSAVWLNKEALPVWNGENVWNDIMKKEQDAARLTFFTTAFGSRLSLYEDLYTVPENPEEAYYADMGIYFDEPNALDFLEMFASNEKIVEAE